MLFTNKHIYMNTFLLKKIAPAFLLFYSFFIVFAAFHHHNINYQSHTTSQIEQTSATEKGFDPFLDENSVCQLSIYSNTKILINIISGLNLLPLQVFETIQTNYENHYSSRYFYNIDLRAPPSIS